MVLIILFWIFIVRGVEDSLNSNLFQDFDPNKQEQSSSDIKGFDFKMGENPFMFQFSASEKTVDKALEMGQQIIKDPTVIALSLLYAQYTVHKDLVSKENHAHQNRTDAEGKVRMAAANIADMQNQLNANETVVMLEALQRTLFQQWYNTAVSGDYRKSAELSRMAEYVGREVLERRKALNDNFGNLKRFEAEKETQQKRAEDEKSREERIGRNKQWALWGGVVGGSVAFISSSVYYALTATSHTLTTTVLPIITVTVVGGAVCYFIALGISELYNGM